MIQASRAVIVFRNPYRKTGAPELKTVELKRNSQVDVKLKSWIIEKSV